ncbi:MAG TPA: AAA family ATPase, partial [Acidimicrobiales bacterium]
MSGVELVGRDEELAILADCLSEALDGRPQLVVCQGEPGIGKTRLAEELVRSAGARSTLSAWGLAADSLSAPPYWPWRQVLRAVGNSVDLVSISKTRRLDADLVRLVPDLFDWDEAHDPIGGSPEDRFRQFDAVSRLLREVTRLTPLLIVLDDAHWADKPTLLLLQHLARSMTDERVLILVNSRIAEQRHGALLSGLVREPVTKAMHLRGLDAPAVREQLASLVGPDVADEDVAQVRSLTGGNPFFVGEVGRAMADARAGRRFPLVTPTVRHAIADRLSRLSPDCVKFVQAAAIVGRSFTVPVVATMLDAPALRALEQVDEAEYAGLVEPDAAQHQHQHSFVHALVCDAIVASIDAPSQVRLHRRAADAIEQHYIHDLRPHLFDIARHWAEAAVEGDAATATAWIERAGQEAMRQLAYEEGARLFCQALQVGGRHLDDGARCRLLLAAAEGLGLSADLEGRLDACREAATLARRMGRPELVAAAALVMDPSGWSDLDVATRRLCEEALAALSPEPSALRAR